MIQGEQLMSSRKQKGDLAKMNDKIRGFMNLQNKKILMLIFFINRNEISSLYIQGSKKSLDCYGSFVTFCHAAKNNGSNEGDSQNGKDTYFKVLD